MNDKKMSVIKQHAEKICAFYDVALYSIEFVREGGYNYLRVIIDKPEGISTEDCELVSRAMSKKLDELDLIDERYFLELSSPGKDEYVGVPDLSKKQ